MNIKIKKASGIIEDFNPDKLLESLIRAGADRDQAEEVISRIVADIQPYTSTKKIFRLAHKYLRQFNRATVLRYSLKKSLLRLGPSGYPFEKYVGELFKHYGYSVSTGVILAGRCVTHEVDVFAFNNSEIRLVECKYRNRAENAPDVKVAMYFHSRFRDLRAGMKNQYEGKSFSGWLVTNTRFTEDAIKYSVCGGIKLMSWRYPDKDSLEQMIEKKKLYPVTVISSLTSGQIRTLFEQKIILMRDLADMAPGDIKGLLSISDRKALALKEQADKLCFC
ncbi:MAG: restriction endonuclease [Nitrospirae bacterium]|nr:restriction endonuclease [Nitrospirota bacterium]